MFFKRQLSSEKRKKSVNFFYLNLHCTGKGYSVKKHNCRPKTFFKKMPSLRKTANGPSFIYRTMTMGFFVTTAALQICYISSIWKKITTFVSIIWTMEIHSLICIWHGGNVAMLPSAGTKHSREQFLPVKRRTNAELVVTCRHLSSFGLYHFLS